MAETIEKTISIPESVMSAKNIKYDNGNSGLTAETAQAAIDEVNEKANTAANIAKGRNQAHVFLTTADMQNWLKNEANKGLYNVGDNIYIVEVEVPDWWVAEVLDTPDAETGYYYKVAQLETQKVDLTEVYNAIAEINAAFPFKVEIDDEAGIINIIDR